MPVIYCIQLDGPPIKVPILIFKKNNIRLRIEHLSSRDMGRYSSILATELSERESREDEAE